jgi:hypothetical protein
MTFQAYLDTIKAKTGLGPDDFIRLADERGLVDKQLTATAVYEWLDADYGLGRGHAMAVFSILSGRHDDSHTDKEARIDKQFAGARAVWQVTWDELMATVMKFGSDVSVAPTDTYISILRGSGKFAIVATTAKRMDVGLKLKGEPATERLAPAGNWNSMVTHRVQVPVEQIADGAGLDAELTGWLREAYDRAAK